MYQNETTSSGKLNPSFRAMKSVMNRYKDSTVDDTDIVEIRCSNNDKFPNAKIYVSTKYDMNFVTNKTNKSVNFISRIKPKTNYNMIFKIYGCYVENIIGDNLHCRIIDYNNYALPIILKSDNVNISIGEVIDTVGYIREGLYNGECVCDYLVKRVRKSEEYNYDMFRDGIFNYNEYINELTSESPF